MNIKKLNCPSCGASIKVKKDQEMISCPYCDSTIVVQDEIPRERVSKHITEITNTSQIPVEFATESIKRSCSGVVISLAISLLFGIGILVFFLINSSDVDKMLEDPIGSLTGGGIPVILEFGGPGMGAGYFQEPEHICVGPEGNIYVGEFETGKIQIFDNEGNFLDQWNFGKSDEIYLRSMALSRDGLLYMVYDGELYIHDAVSGDVLGSLQHPDGWGFDDVEVCDDGSIVASWYCNRDDIIKFAPDGSIDFVIREAISSQTGDSELDTDISVDGMGNIFAYGSFNESVFKFSPQGRFLNRFGSDGDRPGQFTSPSSMCTDPQGRLWVSDFGDLIVFDNNGTYMDTFDPGMTIYDMAMGDGYQLYGITYEKTVVQLDLTESIDNL